jgi:hypothetical protein
MTRQDQDTIREILTFNIYSHIDRYEGEEQKIEIGKEIRKFFDHWFNPETESNLIVCSIFQEKMEIGKAWRAKNWKDAYRYASHMIEDTMGVYMPEHSLEADGTKWWMKECNTEPGKGVAVQIVEVIE